MMIKLELLKALCMIDLDSLLPNGVDGMFFTLFVSPDTSLGIY